MKKGSEKFAKSLRLNSTETENKLWYHLRAKRFEDLKFRRQVPLGPFTVDFVCFEKRIIIELDGGQHAETENADKRRDDYFKEKGFQVLRFWDNEVIENMAGVLEKIKVECG